MTEARASRGDAPYGNAAPSISAARILQMLNKYQSSNLCCFGYTKQRRKITMGNGRKISIAQKRFNKMPA